MRGRSRRSVERQNERERTTGIEQEDDAARWLAENDAKPVPPPPKSASKSKTLHRWRQQQQRQKER